MRNLDDENQRKSPEQSREAAPVAAVGRPHEEFSFHTWRLLTVKSAAAATAAASRDHVCKLL